MESHRVGYWLQVGANIGILAGLVLVGLQISQNSELTRLSIYSSDEDGYLMLGSMWAGETFPAAWSKAIESPESLTATEFVQIHGFLDSVIIQLLRRQGLYEEGLYEISGVEYTEWVIPKYFSNAFARAWWHDQRQHYGDGVLMAAIDKAMADVDINGHARSFETIRRSIEALE